MSGDVPGPVGAHAEVAEQRLEGLVVGPAVDGDRAVAGDPDLETVGAAVGLDRVDDLAVRGG